MPKYAIVPNRVILVAGAEVTPEDQIATVECELPVHDVLALLQFRNATLVNLDAPLDDANDDSTSSDSDMHSPFAAYSAKTQDALEKAGITTLPQAALWLRDHKDFTKLGIAKGVAAELAKQIESAGIPTK